VLLVDDDDDFRTLCARILREQGYRVSQLGDGDQLIAHLEGKGAPDLIVTDLMMPGRTGWAALGDLRRDTRYASVPVVVMTSRDDEDFRQMARTRGAQAYVLKPVGPRELIDVVREALAAAAQPADPRWRDR